MLQERLIARVRELCREDARLSAALIYGSFVTGEADEHSDVEFWLFSDEPVDPLAWLDAIGPARHVVVNEFGAHVVFFPGLVSGEFHFAGTAEIASVGTWPARGAPAEHMVVVDRTGALRVALDSLPAEPVLPDDVGELCGRFANWLVLAYRVAARGELLRAVDALAHVQRHLLWMARLAEGRTRHWLTPSRAAETDLPPDVVAALHRVTADAASVTPALAAAWVCGRGYWVRLVPSVPVGLFEELDAAFLS
ncbi:nucleotidyltransferase domain-containing protein [Actinoplanes palleronii]|uniref:Lincosamide nucleotidyltransferase-like C-terminal domain-containing protein n=1 Tax=Actinoplanes palleronii TaxID=113570 RepID=A0ABQ4B149_9ACTN|nr:nucleotidyltransferase domain-containing protein [Actinoplanes palleronii]GIE64306.1 hypothetical protein Apa02nite_004140 [Actinoplanes palleronii]